jgi:hypothetical protein
MTSMSASYFVRSLKSFLAADATCDMASSAP